jgi:hypothetical protein
MTVFNVHRRAVAASADEVGRLLDTLAGPGDRLWPHERWPAMRFDQPGITPGGRGGHGPIRYRVVSHEPGRSVTFEFLGRPRGLHGHHQFVVHGTGPDSCVLWHLTDLEPRFPMSVTWRVVWRPLHDALIEDALTKAQEAGEGIGATPPTWSSYVRLLRRASAPFVGRARPRAEVTHLVP